MNKYLSLNVALVSVILSSSASAHSGSHAELSTLNILQHALSSPVHAGIALAIASIATMALITFEKSGK